MPLDEVSIYREIEQLLKTAKDSLLTDIVPSNCNCKTETTKRVFRCPEAFKINMLLEQLEKLRQTR
jgi:hypothetical protein